MDTQKRIRIISVDDEPVVCQVIERALSREYEVMTLPSGDKLEEALESFQPELVILDVMMPRETGWDLCARLRRKKAFDAIPIIFLSAVSGETSVRRGFASGGDFYLPKPFTVRELVQIVEIFLGRKHRHPDESVTI